VQVIEKHKSRQLPRELAALCGINAWTAIYLAQIVCHVPCPVKPLTACGGISFACVLRLPGVPSSATTHMTQHLYGGARARVPATTRFHSIDEGRQTESTARRDLVATAAPSGNRINRRCLTISRRQR